MIEQHVRERCTGKTTEIIIRAKENESLFVLVPSQGMKKIYPKDLQDRVLTYSELKNGTHSGRRVSKLLIDEGYLYSPEKMVELYYNLGKLGIDIEVYGTI